MSATASSANCGNDEEQVGDGAQQLVDDAAEVAGRRADEHAEQVENSGDREADPQRDLPGVEQHGELVATELVGAEPVLERRRVAAPTSGDVDLVGEYGAT